MSRSYGDPCGVARGLDVIGERWALLVVRDLLLGPKRFNDLLGGLSGVSPNVLTQRLRELADCGVVRRRDLGPPARAVLYELTDWGRDLEPLLLHLGRWGSRAPSPPDGELGIDSLLLSLKAGFDQTRAGDVRGTYQLDIDGDTYVLRVADGTFEIERGATGQPSATLTTGLDTFRAVAGGRITIPAARRSGRLRITGDKPSIRHLTDLLLVAA
jgi:DNA-binding HxlR family transcriptional regulator